MVRMQTRSDHVKLLKSFLSSFEANFGECVLIFALLRNPVFLNALNYIKQIEEHLKCAILSCIAEFSSTQELLALGYDLTNDQLKYAKKRAKKNIYQVLSNDNEDCEKLQKKLNDQQIQMIENVILPFTTEQQANSKSPTIPSAHIMKRHGKAKCDSEIGEIKTSLYQNLPANGIENIEKLQEALIENTKRCSNKKEFIIHKDQEQFIGKTIQVKNIKSYLFFKRESEIADVQALHTFESSNSTKINMTEKEISKKDRKHSSRKQTVPQTSTPPKVMNIIESRIQKDNNDQNDEDDEDDDMQHSQTDQQQELEPIRIVKRKRRRIELDSDEDEEENIYQNDEQYDEFEEMVPSDQFGEDEDQELIALKSAFKKNGRNKQKKY
ncbi:MAG: hypothetical protein EZS28_004038 [Streblomastix strix]|uniref:Uncharacterized protein n=1 Tax=Streblomastix strix TaxID=222440 RepID=A0A5J4WZ89_9EUKA|nr:MAG: hypothetical protein EZS28_004038 [Streblomastix strix]